MLMKWGATFVPDIGSFFSLSYEKCFDSYIHLKLLLQNSEALFPHAHNLMKPHANPFRSCTPEIKLPTPCNWNFEIKDLDFDPRVALQLR
jgi:hypothetical protein